MNPMQEFDSKLGSWLNLPMPFPSSSSNVIAGYRFDRKFIGVVESVEGDVVTVRLEAVTEKVYGTSALSIWPRLARLEKEINQKITQIFQENPSLP